MTKIYALLVPENTDAFRSSLLLHMSFPGCSLPPSRKPHSSLMVALTCDLLWSVPALPPGW